jgi:glutamate dehydrogenase/leucine dehydrogenase
MTRRFTSEIVNEIGPEKDIPAPDVGTNAAVMAWIFDTYSMNRGHSVLGVVTGKPLTIGGSLGREEATARGALFCLEQALKRTNRAVDGLRVAVQGFGNVGSFFAKLAAELGVTVATASRTVDALAARGLVLREADPADARAVRVAATRAGIEDQKERRRRFTERLGGLMDELSEHERRQLADSLETLNRLFAHRDEAARGA